MMSSLLSKYHPPNLKKQTQLITPDKANWSYVGFESIELKKGQSINLNSDKDEICVVVISGKCTVSSTEISATEIGQRMCPFERKKPWSVYINNLSLIHISEPTRPY